MRISFYGTYLSEITGTRGASETIAAELAREGHSVRLVSRRAQPLGRVLDSLSAAATESADLAVLDVFSSRVIWLTRTTANILARRQIQFIAILRGGALIDRFDEVQKPLVRIVSTAARVVTPSRFLQAGLRERGIAVDYLPNPLDLRHFPYRERSRPRETLRLLWVRAFSEIYRPPWAVEVVHALLAQGIDATLTMVGPDRGLLAKTQARAAELGVTNRITFAGPVANTELHAYYHSHDFLLNTTRFESFGVAIAEAAATGLPCVSAAVGELAYSWTDGKEILLVPGKSSADFAECIGKLVRQDGEGVLYRQLSVNAHQKVKAFELSKIVLRWQELLREVTHA